MNDLELAEEIERYLAKAPRSTMVLGYDPPIWQQIIAALRRGSERRDIPGECAKALIAGINKGLSGEKLLEYARRPMELDGSALIQERPPSGEMRLTDEEIIAAWNDAVPDANSMGIKMYLHLMRAVADAQYRKLSTAEAEGRKS